MINQTELEKELEYHRSRENTLVPTMFCVFSFAFGVLVLRLPDPIGTNVIVAGVIFVFSFCAFVPVLIASIVHKSACAALLSVRKALVIDEQSETEQSMHDETDEDDDLRPAP